MIVIDQTIISDDILDAAFCCNTQVCLGACCVDGDVGAPLEESEISALEDYIERIKPYLQPEAIRIIERYGVFDYDAEGEFVTPLIGNKDCVFVYYEMGSQNAQSKNPGTTALPISENRSLVICIRSVLKPIRMSMR